MQHEPKLQEARGDIKRTADEALQKKDFNRLDYLSLAYLMTDNKEYADVKMCIRDRNISCYICCT